MTTTKEAAATIRQALKARGWNSRMISVRGDNYSLGSSIRVTIKSDSIPMQVVRDIATGVEEIDRCEVTGEILSGGNRFVFVDYDADVLVDMTYSILQALEALEGMSEGTIDTIRGFDVYHLRGTWHGTREGFESLNAHDIHCTARVLAERTAGMPEPVPESVPVPEHGNFTGHPTSADLASAESEPYPMTLVAFGG